MGVLIARHHRRAHDNMRRHTLCRGYMHRFTLPRVALHLLWVTNMSPLSAARTVHRPRRFACVELLYGLCSVLHANFTVKKDVGRATRFHSVLWN